MRSRGFIVFIALLSIWNGAIGGSPDSIWHMQLTHRQDTSCIRYVRNDEKVFLRFSDNTKMKGRLNIIDSTDIMLKNARLIFMGSKYGSGDLSPEYSDIIQMEVKSRNILMAGIGILIAGSIIFNSVMQSSSEYSNAVGAISFVASMGIFGGSMYMIIHPYHRFNLVNNWELSIIPDSELKPDGKFVQ